MQYFPLLDSGLIPFRACTSEPDVLACTEKVINELLRVTTLADQTARVQISCTNIWRTSSVARAKPLPLTIVSPTRYNSVLAMSHKAAKTNQPRQEDGAKFANAPSPTCDGARFFVIKSFSALDVEASVRHQVWTSTELGNDRLSKAFKGSGVIYLFFSVNGSGKFCGVAQMIGPVDYSRTSDIWVEATRWKGVFPLRWLINKEVPNKHFRNLRVPSNENKPVTSSRDTQELPFAVGVAMIQIFARFQE